MADFKCDHLRCLWCFVSLKEAAYKIASDITNFKNTITISLSSIENKLLENNRRLSSTETSLCNVYDVAGLPPVTQNPSPLDTSPIFPICELLTRANVTLPKEHDLN